MTPFIVCPNEMFVKRKNRVEIILYFKFKVLNLISRVKTKKDLMDYIIYYMIRKLVEIEATQRESLKQMSLYNILRNNLVFLFNYRFFFRDRKDAEQVYEELLKDKNTTYIKADYFS